MSQPTPIISVVIPAYNCAEQLRSCLAALARQTLPGEQFEVIVVDNGSKSSPRPVVDEFSFCRFFEEASPGSYAARNCGLQNTRGQIIAFTDSDCIPDPNWLASAWNVLESNPGCGFIGGRIDVFPADPGRPSAVELYDMIFWLDQESYVHHGKFAATANMITRRTTIDRVGVFNDQLKSGGDTDWGHRATEMGLRGIYSDTAIVRHPARATLRDLLQKARRTAGGRYDRHEDNQSRYKSLHLWRMLWRFACPQFRKMREAWTKLRGRGFGVLAWVRVVGIIVVVQYAVLFEMARKWSGARSKRT